jgi:hypothetical protein
MLRLQEALVPPNINITNNAKSIMQDATNNVNVFCKS